MKVDKLPLSGLLLIEPKSFADDRGFFLERYNEKSFQEFDLPTRFVQDNFSRSQKGVLRGLHAQWQEPQAKLITCLSGRIFDVVVDIRHKSPTFGQSFSVELDGQLPRWLYVPAGFAHGFLALSQESADVMYKVDCFYNPAGEFGLLWNDPDLNIAWPTKNPLLSPKDQGLGSWKEYVRKPWF
jgi:dTDP-4-dehydrorhamnose 3,5-epimerase